MNERFLVPKDARPPAIDESASQRRRPSPLDERTLVPAMLPVVPLQERTNIPASLPLEAVAARIVVPRDVKQEAYAVEEKTLTPVQPTDLNERTVIPQGVAPPPIIKPLESVAEDIVDADIFMTGEVNLLTKEKKDERVIKWDMIIIVSSLIFHSLLLLLIIFAPKLFPTRRSKEDEDIARRQIAIFLPPGALDAPKVQPKPRELNSEKMRVDPRVLNKVAPPEPQPAAPKVPEPVVKELPSAPKPKTDVEQPQPSDPVAKTETPKLQTPKLETPDQQPTQHGLLLPKNSPGRSLQDSIRDASKMNTPRAIVDGGDLPGGGARQGGGGKGQAFGNMELLTPTEGVDFNDYLARVYQSVKRNWYAVMPESVMLGDKGIVSLQFKIMRDGSVPSGDPARVRTSGKEPLDRAAISSIRASNPFGPLPAAFKGPYIELRFTYYYNIPIEYTQPQQ